MTLLTRCAIAVDGDFFEFPILTTCPLASLQFMSLTSARRYLTHARLSCLRSVSIHGNARSGWLASRTSGRPFRTALFVLVHGIEESCYHHREPCFDPMCQREEFIHRLCAGIAPSAARCGSHYGIVIFREGNLDSCRTLPRSTSTGTDDDSGRTLQHSLGSTYDRFDRTYGLVDDQLHANRTRQMVHAIDVAYIRQQSQDCSRCQRSTANRNPPPNRAKLSYDPSTDRPEPQRDSRFKQLAAQVRSDESSTASNQYLHLFTLK